MVIVGAGIHPLGWGLTPLPFVGTSVSNWDKALGAARFPATCSVAPMATARKTSEITLVNKLYDFFIFNPSYIHMNR